MTVVARDDAMTQWSVDGKIDTLGAICDRALAGEPQFVTRGGVQTVVVVSYVDYKHFRVKKRRHVVNNPKLAFKIAEDDLFSDDTAIWEACNA